MPLRLNSIFKNLLSDYREIKLANGIKDVSIDRYISYIDDFICSSGIQEIAFTDQMVKDTYKKRNTTEGDLVRYIRINYLIDFLSYVRSLGYEVCIPRRMPHKPSNFIATIFTDEQIKNYFKYVDQFKNIRDPMVALYVPVIFRILYGCGTRIGETLSLKVEDVDLENGILFLKETKNRQHRAVPVSDSLLIILKKYSEKCLYLKTTKSYFFSHIDGKRVSEQSIYNIHRKALESAGIPYVGSTKGPSLHDWRHTMAVTSLENFEKRGCDLNNVLPILSKYLGHTTIFFTEKYLQLVEHHFDSVLDKSEQTEKYIMGKEDDYD